VDILINDDLTGVVLFTSCVVGGVFTALVGGCWTFATHRDLTVDISIISFFIGFLLVRRMLQTTLDRVQFFAKKI
jgi:hypothetical protein